MIPTKRNMTRIKAVKILKFSLVACVFLLQYKALQAQTVINKIETKQVRPGEITTLTVFGRGFSAVKRVEAVKVGELEVSVLGYTIESDEEARVEIRIPRFAPTGRHKIAIRVSGEGFVEWLAPRTANTETVRPLISGTVSDPGPPPMAGVEIWLDGAPISEELNVIRFDTTSVGTPVNKSITVKNNGLATLILRNLQIPAGLQLLEALPDSIPAGESTKLTLQFSAAAGGSFSGIMQFSTNASNQSTVTLQLLATVIPAQTFPVRGRRIDFLIISVIALLAVGSGLIFVRRIIKKKVVKIRPVVDVGTQQIKQGTSVNLGFELRLERQLDYGKSSINSGGQLVKEQ